MEPSVADRPNGETADNVDGSPARATYQAELEQLRIQVELMGVRVDQNLERMRSVLHHGDVGEGALAIEADDEIDAMQVSLTERCYDLLAREQPVADAQWRAAIRSVTLLLAPIAPFVTEEVWREALGEPESVHRAAWPAWDEALAVEAQTTVVVQVNGRLRDRLTADADSDAVALRELALGNERVQTAIGGRAVRDVIVAGRLVNVVTL